jgi:hypothetical protein
MPMSRPSANPRPRRRARLASTLAGLFLLGSWLAVAAAPAASAASGAQHHSGKNGWIRLTHLSPNTPPVDVYLYSFGMPKAMIVLKHVGYGAVSPYEKVASGEYTVAMRAAGAAPGSQPVLSTSVKIVAGGAYTVAGMGPKSGLRLQVLRDRLATPKDESLVRVIQASLRDHTVTVTAGSRVLAHGLPFAHVTGYGKTTPGTYRVSVSGESGSAAQSVTLGAGTIHTLVVLDGANGLMIDNLEDAAGSAVMPNGGAGMGLGGTAPVPAPSPVPWAAAGAAGALCALAGAYWLRRSRTSARRAR